MFFFFQAEDGIRDGRVTGVQTCALPIYRACRGDTVSPAHPGLRLGRIGAWLNPVYGDDARTCLAIQAESLGYPTAWLGFGRASVSDLALAERILDATSTITVATAIVNIWTNDAADVATSYR